MRKQLVSYLGLWGLVGFILVGSCTLHRQAMAQTDSATIASAVQVSCPATGSSIEAIAANFRRRSVSIQNKSGKAVRLGFVASGTPGLNTTNSFTLEASSNFIDSAPGVFAGRIVCASTDGTAAVVDVTQTLR